MKLPFSFAHKLKMHLIFQSRVVVVGFYLLCLLPTAALFLSIDHKKNGYTEMKEEVACLAARMERMKELQKDRSAFFKTYRDVDHFFVDHAIESMHFLKPETEALTLALKSPAFESCDTIIKRLSQLTKENNRFIFSEGSRRAKNKVEEVELIQKRPVEINAHDLRNILRVIEGISIDEEKPPPYRPQFIIQRFQLNKKKLAERETYQLEMHLIKREATL